jgi:hypothetical protein
MQFDSMILEVKQLVADANLAGQKSGQTVDLGDMDALLADIESLREDDIRPVEEALDKGFKQAATGTTIVGAVLLVLSFWGIFGAMLLVRSPTLCSRPTRKYCPRGLAPVRTPNALRTPCSNAGKLSAGQLPGWVFHLSSHSVVSCIVALCSGQDVVAKLVMMFCC